MRFTRNQQGFSPIFIVLILVVVAAVGFAGWKVSQNQKDSTSGSGSTAALNSQAQDACLKEINDKNFCKFVGHFNLNASYAATITSTDSKGTVSKIELQSDSKSNSMMVTKDGSGNETGAFVTLNNASYIKDVASGTWTKYTNSTTASDSNPTKDISIDTSDITEKNTVTYKSLGTEACGKLTCYKYQVVDTASPGTTQYIWFDTKNYQMQRWSSKDADGSTDMVFTYKSVNITEPSPVKEASSATSAPNAAEINAALQAAQAASMPDDSESGQ
jgi:outer membrane lipoprotein-sorting protein